MPLTYQFVPLERSPERRSARKKARFDTSYSETLKLLERELSHLSASHIVIQADVKPHQIRNDGLLRSQATPSSPAIVLSFASKYGELSYPCDQFTHWQDNLRAIALSLEALRMVDRYGVTKRAEQYQGWAKLPPPGSSGSSGSQHASISTSTMTADEADRVLGVNSVHGISEDELKEAYRAAAKRHHPDAGGDPETFKRVTEAYELLLKSAN